jgi:predicted nucleotidyltransferase
MIDKITQRENQIINNSIEIFNKYLHTSKIYLFGSRTKGMSYKNSDFDFAIDGEKPDRRIEREMKDEIEKIAGLYSIDIIYLKDVENDFRNIILKTGEIIYER